MADAWGGSWGSSWGFSWGEQLEYPNYVRLGWWPCDRCGVDYPEGSLRREWTGMRCCRNCWDPRHPQDAVRGVLDSQGVGSVARPEPDDYFLATNEVSAGDL